MTFDGVTVLRWIYIDRNGLTTGDSLASNNNAAGDDAAFDASRRDESPSIVEKRKDGYV